MLPFLSPVFKKAIFKFLGDRYGDIGGYTDKANRKTQELFKCLVCNHKENADINASKNILAVGHTVLACGEDALATSTKQEPQQCEQSLVA